MLFVAACKVGSRLPKNVLYPAFPGLEQRWRGLGSSVEEVVEVLDTSIAIRSADSESSPGQSTANARRRLVSRMRVEVDDEDSVVLARFEEREDSSRIREMIESISSRDAERISSAFSQKTFAVRPFDHAS